MKEQIINTIKENITGVKAKIEQGIKDFKINKEQASKGFEIGQSHFTENQLPLPYEDKKLMKAVNAAIATIHTANAEDYLSGREYSLAINALCHAVHYETLFYCE